MFNKKKNEVNNEEVKPTPAYLSDDYPYQAVGEAIKDFDSLISYEFYEIKCNKCEMSIRSQGCNIKGIYDKLMMGNGCLGCGNKELVVKRVDTSKMKVDK